MALTDKQVALVTGASRGVGKGIAIALGEKGMRVYVTGRTKTVGAAKAWDGSSLPGTVQETADAVTAAGGDGIALYCDHANDAETEAVFSRIAKESGKLDILVNNATHMPPDLIEDLPFWQKSIGNADMISVGLRSAYLCSWHAARLMVPMGSGLICFTSSFGAACYMHGPAYGAQKAGVDKFAHDMAIDLAPYNIHAVSLWLGPQLTERAKIAAKVKPEEYAQFMEVAEHPGFVADIIHAVARDPEAKTLSGEALIIAEIAARYGLTDRNGKTPPSHREMLGNPLIFSDAVVK